MKTGVAFLKVCMVYAWATSVGLCNSSVPASSKTSLQDSSSQMFKNSTLQTSIDYTHTFTAPHDEPTPTLTTSQFQNSSLTEPDTTSTQSLFDSIQLETTLSSTIIDSIDSSLLSNKDNDIAQLSSTSDFLSTTIVYSTTFKNTEPIDYEGDQSSEWLFSTNELDNMSTFSDGESSEVFAEPSFSEEPQVTSIQIWSSHIQFTSTVPFQTTTVSKLETELSLTPSSTTTVVATSIPETPTQKPLPQDRVKADSADDLSSGSKVAIGVIVAVCVVGVIVAGVIVYRRYNITHRSLKSFLTSGIRYKTYNNAIYKDDEVVGEVGIASQLT